MSKNRKHNEKVEKRIEEQEVIPDEKVAEKTSGKPEEESNENEEKAADENNELEELKKSTAELEKKLTASAEAASREAVERAFAAGLSVTVLRDNRIVRVAPDGTETLVEVLTFDD